MPFDLIPLLWLCFGAAICYPKLKYPRKYLLRWAIVASFALLCLQVALTFPHKQGFEYFDVRNGQRTPILPLVDSIFPERRVVSVGSLLFDSLMEREGKGGGRYEKVVEQYDDLEKVAGKYFPSPIFAGMFLHQSDKHFRVIKFPAKGKDRGPAVFLHGGAGNYVMECWLMASILTEAGFTTYCPTYDFVGWWPKPEGQDIFEQLVKYLHKEYPWQKILLSGLSNGGHGALEFSWKYEEYIWGMILVSGGIPKYSQGRVQGLILWGRQDERIPIENGRQIYERMRNWNEIEEVDGDHFVFMRKHKHFEKVILEWLHRQKLPGE